VQGGYRLLGIYPLQEVVPQGLLAIGPSRQGEDADDSLAGGTRLQVGVDGHPDTLVGGVRQQVVTQL
jgi:hypothetical protein